MAAPSGAVTATTSVRASKTWVLPPRPKPGRKSKKELAAANKQDLDDEEAERIASRTKQKASRERKQEYIAELEAKVRTYEQGDGERASFFQELAKRYSEERDALKVENEQLRLRLSRYESTTPPVVPPQLARKASTDLHPAAKRQKTRSASLASNSSGGAAAMPSPPPVASTSFPPKEASARTNKVGEDVQGISRETTSTSMFSVHKQSTFEADHTAQRHHSQPVHLEGCGLCEKTSSTQCVCQEIELEIDRSGSYIGTSSIAPATTATADTSCGLCDETASTSCICRDMGLKSAEPATILPSKPYLASCGFCEETASSCICKEVGLSPSSGSSNAATPKDITIAVPLRSIRKSVTGTVKRTIWRLDNMQPVVVKAAPPNPAPAREAMRRSLIKVGSRLPCSGDPRTCPACADDPAGQAFCSALSNSVCATNPCASCPNRPSPLSKEVTARETTPAAMPTTDKAVRQALRRRESSSRDDVPDAMIPCSDAWATLRAHPNIGYANLDLLANVVAKRTHCAGERKDSEGKIVRVDREGVEEALDLLDQVGQ